MGRGELEGGLPPFWGPFLGLILLEGDHLGTWSWLARRDLILNLNSLSQVLEGN